MVVAMFLAALLFVQKATDLAPAIAMSGKRLAAAFECEFLTTELVLFDTVTWASRQVIRVIPLAYPKLIPVG